MIYQLMSRLNEGGPVFMYPILLLLILIISLIVKGLMSKDKTKVIELISAIGIFTLVWGLLGQTIGLVGAFDSIEMSGGKISPGLMAAGLKVSLLTTIFGSITFLVSRVGIIVLIWLRKEPK